MLDGFREVRRLSELRKMRCGGPSCKSFIGLGDWSVITISRLTKTGVEPSVYQISCPRYLDNEMCHYSSLVVFVSPEAEDPDSLALEATMPHLESWCAHCRRTLDWGKAKTTWKEDGDGDVFDEVELSLSCPLTWKERFSKIMGRRVIRHGHVRNVRWVEDDEDEDDDIPDHVPDGWIVSPQPAPV